MITYEGERVYPDGNGFPTLNTIGVSLGRMPRFCGHTKEWYPVLAHVMVVAEILPDKAKLAGLMHDAPEVCCADVPTPWKTQVARNREHRLLERIYRGNGLGWPINEKIQGQVDEADRMVLAAEAHVLGHPAASEFWPNPDPYVMDATREQLALCGNYIYPRCSGPLFVAQFEAYRELAPKKMRSPSRSDLLRV